MKQIIPEIYIRDCKNALNFYREAFGGEIKNLQMSDSLEMFRDVKNKVIHAELHINSRCVCYFVDIFQPKRSKTGNVTIMLHLESKEEIKRIYSVLSVDGQVEMELQAAFGGAYHAIVTDQYGAPWALNFADPILQKGGKWLPV